MFRKILILFFGLSFITISQAKCPIPLSDKEAINIAKHAMNEWFSAVEKGKIKKVKALLAPQFVILHSQGAPMTRTQELQLLTGFQLGGYHFSDFCAMRIDNTIIATFSSKTFKEDVSKTHLSFLNKYKAYRMLVMKKIKGQWLIVAYANTNPITTMN